MHKLEIKNYSFTYAGTDKSTLSDINIEVSEGEYILLCGTSGSGKTTFLKSVKPEVTPNGSVTGSITLDGNSIGNLSPMESACKIGYVFQSPENQIVTDTVQHEMSFGLENLGIRSNIIRRKVAETAGFFGIDAWFNKKTSELSGGQKQLLNLASVVVMEPEILLLDEPTAQLDPIASKEFLSMLARLNKELGITVIICEHRFEEVFSSVSSVVIIQNGKLSEKYSARDFAAELVRSRHSLAGALPAGIRISEKLDLGVFPLNVNETRNHLTSNSIRLARPETRPPFEGKTVLEMKDAWFRYDRLSDFVIRDTNIKLKQNEIHAIVGGNGMGKSTLLRLMSGLSRPDRGKCKIHDKLRVSLLMQDPKTLFICDSVHDELREMQETFGYSDEKIKMYTKRFSLDNIDSRHPYDLSGGEMQKLAMVKVLLTDPDIVLLDEPTKGTDAENRHEICSLLNELRNNGKTILFVTHDLEFAAETADTCSFMFNGQIICTDDAKQFFTGNRYYTTAINRITRGISDGCVTLEDVNIEK